MKTALWRLAPAVVVVIGALACSAGCALPARGINARARVMNVTLESESPARPTPCPSMVPFRGTVVAATAGVVRFRFRLDDGTVSPFVNMPMKAQETRDVVHFLRVDGHTPTRGTLQFEVTGSGGVRRARSGFAVTCEAETEREVEEENPLESSVERDPRDRPMGVFGEQRLRDYERLQAVRDAQDKPYRLFPLPPLPDALDAEPCAWSSIGPTNISGRITHIAIDPTDNRRLFVASVGGIWRSTDGARRWQRVSDDVFAGPFASVAINPTNQAEVFAGGGDPNFHNGLSGVGIWRSTANGDPGTWSKVSPQALDGQIIYRLRIDPSVPNSVYAATSNGVYVGTRSAGSVAFARVSGFDAWTTDLVVDFSATPRLVYAGVRQASATYGRGVWKYDGTNWTQRTTGIPTADSGTISLALAPSNPAVLYAHVTAASTGQLQGAYKTETAAEPPNPGADAWNVVAGSATLNDSGYAAYNSVIEIDPANEDIAWSGGVNLFRTSDGGTTWSNVASGTDVSYPVFAHNDHHAIAFDPTNSKIVYAGTDGGVFRSTDTSSASWHWNNVSHGLDVTQFFKLTSQQALPGVAAGGTQDTGIVLTFGNRTWYQPFFCDGWMVAFDAPGASTLYISCNYFLNVLTNPVPGTGGSNVTWTLPSGVAIRSPVVADPVLAGATLAVGTDGTSQRLLKTTDGVNWNNASPNLASGQMIPTIATASSSAFQTYYVATTGNEIWRTTDGGATWARTSTGLSTSFFWTFSIGIDATNPSRALAATGNGLYLTTNTGSRWDLISGTGTTGLPTNVVMGAVFDPTDPNTVYAATGVGAFRGTITPAAGPIPAVGAWTPFDEGLPDGLPITDIWVNPITKRLKISSMGYGAFERDIRPGISCPATRLLVRDNVLDRGETPSPSGLPDPEHPIPDPARRPFFKPDDTGAGRLYWWNSTDVRIDVPSTAPAKNQIASADHVEFESCPIHVGDCPAGSIRDADPRRGQSARVYVQVNNTGLRAASNVRVTALFADASTGLPDLPLNFWTTTFPANSTTCGALTPGSGWQFVDAANPCRNISAINPEFPETVRFDWNVPGGQAGHSCILVISESDADPLQPGVRTTNERRLSELVPNNRQISLRNLHVVDAAAGASDEMEAMNVRNPDRQLPYVDLLISSMDLPSDAVIGLLLPTRRGVESEGAQPARIGLSAQQQALARELKVTPDAFYRVTGAGEARIRVPVPPEATWRLGVIYKSEKIPLGSSARLSVIAKQGETVLGGNTYIIRSVEPRRE